MEEERSSRGQMIMIPIVPILVVLAIVFLMMRSRRKSRTDRALDRINRVIDDVELPDRARDVLHDTVEDVRDVMATIRARASEMTG